MNIDLISGQIALLHITLDTTEPYELYGGTTRGAFSFERDGETWHVTAREEVVAGVPLCNYDIYARELATGREWVILSGKIIVKPRTASVPADKLHPVEYFVTVPVRNSQVDAAGNVIVQGIPGPKGDKGEKGEPGEGGMTAEERALLMGAAQRDADNTVTGGNTFTGAVDMSAAQVTPPSGWNVAELTPEAIQAVVPITWDYYSVRLGSRASALNSGTAFGSDAYALSNSCSVGLRASAQNYSTAIGSDAKANKKYNSITIGALFTETTDSGNVTHTCTTEGTGSITIGAGANTLNNGDTESSNSVTIGCKAENKGADSVVIGASANNHRAGTVMIGAGASLNKNDAFGDNVIIGRRAKSDYFGRCVSVGAEATASYYGSAFGYGTSAGVGSTSIGQQCNASGANSFAAGNATSATGPNSISVGYIANSAAANAIAIGAKAKAADYGATVIRSTAEDGTYTQLYFSGANTPLANTYHGGAPMLGYVTKDSAGNIVAAGTRSLIDLLTDNSTFAPASLDENGEWVMPKVFHPSDLDMPQEEPSEPEEYQPLPVYPIVEPEIE
ncbi:MAG: hypothetical protein II295_00905, partial [Akkermansia sp.]|nr:hypothetical protein [Akkermansia sp.]